MIGKAIVPYEYTALLGDVQSIESVNHRFVAIALLLAKRRVAVHWMACFPPVVQGWLTDLTYCMDQLELFAESLPSASRPKDIWALCVHTCWSQLILS